MTAEMMRTLTDDELVQFIDQAQGELKDRTEQRRQEAMEQIRRLASQAQIQITFGNGRVKREAKPLKAGVRYVHPSDPSKAYVVGKGRPPAWFDELRAKGRLPEPVYP